MTLYRCRNGPACEDGPEWTEDSFRFDSARPMGARLCDACWTDLYGRRKRRRCACCNQRFRSRLDEIVCPACRQLAAA